MAFVKLDTGILTSTLWVEREPREVFVTALLMAEPYEIEVPTPAIEVRTLEPLGFVVPPGWYGLVRAAGIGIVRMAALESDEGMLALERLASPDPESRSHAFEGRRMVRVDGGYIILNFMVYRDRDQTIGERMKRYRERIRTGKIPPPPSADTRSSNAATRIPILADADADVEAEKDQKKKTAPKGDLLDGISPQVAKDFTALRAKLRAPITKTALDGIRREAGKAGIGMEEALVVCCERGWRGFKSEWMAGADGGSAATRKRVDL